MKGYFIFVFLLYISSLSAQNGKLTVNITNIRSDAGTIHIGIYNKESDFPKNHKEYKKVIIDVGKSTTLTSYLDLPQGTYAIAIFHDENSDGKCNHNILRIPVEGYGFSNNIKPKFSAPSFNKTKFKLGSRKTIRISLIY